jgi:hypothetical protein
MFAYLIVRFPISQTTFSPITKLCLYHFLFASSIISSWAIFNLSGIDLRLLCNAYTNTSTSELLLIPQGIICDVSIAIMSNCNLGI